jgi:uncharacterized Fe-S radical SAM superfamily protein PflX
LVLIASMRLGQAACQADAVSFGLKEEMVSRASIPPRVQPWIVSGLEPSYLRLDPAELERRARVALRLLGEERCLVCPRLCKVGRLRDEHGLCAIGRQAVVASHFPHFGEENCLRGWNGSGTIFFSGCNLRCVSCQNYDISWEVENGSLRCAWAR